MLTEQHLDAHTVRHYGFPAALVVCSLNSTLMRTQYVTTVCCSFFAEANLDLETKTERNKPQIMQLRFLFATTAKQVSKQFVPLETSGFEKYSYWTLRSRNLDFYSVSCKHAYAFQGREVVLGKVSRALTICLT